MTAGGGDRPRDEAGEGPRGGDAAPYGSARPVTYCYRHPDRPTRITCARCERPICPDDMRTAAVGFQCPECVKEHTRATAPRTVTGARASARAGVVTTALLALNVLIFVVVLASDGRVLYDQFLEVTVLVEQGEWWRLLTSAFLHTQLWHIGLNMLALYWLGPALERDLGWWRFLALYLVSALGGSAASYALTDFGASLGASGAVFGLFGATLVFARRRRLDVSWLYLILAINVVYGFLRPNIDWKAHFGGFAVGALVAWAMLRTPREKRVAGHVAVLAAVTALLVVVVVVRTQAGAFVDL